MRTGVIIGLLGFLLTGFTACQNTAPEGYSRQNGSWYFRYIVIGGVNKIDKADTIRTLVRIKAKDTVLYDARLIFDPGSPVVSHHLISFYHGDSIVFLLPPSAEYRAYLPVQSQDTLIVMMKIMDDDVKRKKNAQLISSPDELTQLTNWLLQAGRDTTRIPDDVVILWDSAGYGAPLKSTDLITIAYRGYRCDGTLVDDSDKNTEPFSFRPCDPDQVLEGILHGIRGMKEGGKRKIIIPSRFAYGSNGSSTGIIAPNTPMIYHIEIVKITRQ